MGRTGFTVVSQAIHAMGWLFRELMGMDIGVDGHVETLTPNQLPTGRLIAVQIKTGESYFLHRRDSGWAFRAPVDRLQYLDRYSLPVIIVLVNPKTRVAYWAHVTMSNILVKGKTWEIVVPEDQVLGPQSAASLGRIADGDDRHVAPQSSDDDL